MTDLETPDWSDRLLDAFTSIRSVLSVLAFCLVLAGVIALLNWAREMPDDVFWTLAWALPVAGLMIVATVVVGIVTNFGRPRG